MEKIKGGKIFDVWNRKFFFSQRQFFADISLVFETKGFFFQVNFFFFETEKLSEDFFCFFCILSLWENYLFFSWMQNIF